MKSYFVRISWILLIWKKKQERGLGKGRGRGYRGMEVETIRPPENRSGDQRPAAGCRNPLKVRRRTMLHAELMDVLEEMLGAAEMQQCHKGPRPETTATTGKQGKCEWGPETDRNIGGRQTSRRFFRRGSKNVCQDIVEEPTTAQAKEGTTHNWRARDVGASDTLGNFARTARKRRNGDKPVGYSWLADIKREQCDM
jgi:hypothetical protein